MADVQVGWNRSQGGGGTTTVTLNGPPSTRPLVVLLHGAGGAAADMVNPLSGPHAGMLFDAHSAIPTVVDRGWHPYPNAGLWSVGSLDALAPAKGWGPFLNDHGFQTAVYDQADPEGLLADPVLELHAIMNTLVGLLPGRGLVLLCDSRGGLLARRFCADLASNAPMRQSVRALVMLHTPNQGSSVATLVKPVVTALRAVAVSVPPVAPVVNLLIGQIQKPDMIEMSPGSQFLTTLAAAEAAGGATNTPAFTFGGSSPRLVRVRNWAFTADSATPHVSGFPPRVQFHWRTVPQEVLSLADRVAALGAIAPELRQGGDLLVTNVNARLPWARRHITNALSHADTLTSPQLMQQALSILTTLPS